MRSINALARSASGGSSPLLFTTINGDLTAYFHPHQFAEFRAFYDSGFAHAYPDVLTTPVFVGLGNHDYENNVGSCFAGTLDRNRCAKNAFNLVRGAVFADHLKAMPASRIESFDAGSLAYSWNYGELHFVQLHNQASYTSPNIGVGASLEWLRADLARAKARGQYIVINVHKPTFDEAFRNAIDGFPVVAVFAGHLHSNSGRFGTIRTPSDRLIPVFLSGSADNRTFLKADVDTASETPMLRVTRYLATTSGATASDTHEVPLVR